VLYCVVLCSEVLCCTALYCAVMYFDECAVLIYSAVRTLHYSLADLMSLLMVLTQSQKLCARLLTYNSNEIISIRFLYRGIPSSSSNSSSGSRVYKGKSIPVLRFTVRVADATGEADTHISGKEAELFLGVTAGNFYRHKTVRHKIKSKLLSLCQSPFPASDPEPAVTTRRVTRGSRAQQQAEIPPVPASVPLLALNLFSYLPAKHTGEAAVRLAVVGTSLNQL
jgi:hypothetical protein